ncbi:sphingosine-1-phosphate lyase [Folsomia candida]|uniref:sphingosine-1-phosphate lyase n=1 Tax=Folsomia candida TaxID=158441 RepID=UPI000B8F2321|nr:sphingosine-1-phosphate lyase [Folsomia candida]
MGYQSFAMLDCLDNLRLRINRQFPYEPVVIVGGTAIAIHLLHYASQRVPSDGFYAGGKRALFSLLKKIPAVKRKVNEEVDKAQKTLYKDIANLYKDKNGECTFITKLSSEGRPLETVLAKVAEYLEMGNYAWKNGTVSGSVYHGGSELTQLNSEVYAMSTWTNPLHPDVFPGVVKMESEVVKMAANLFNGGPNTVGTITSGGSESIILAIKAYRDYGLAKGIIRPEMVVPVTAHAAFEKGAQLMQIKIRKVPITQETWTVDVKLMERMINGNTVMLVGSAPTFPYGCVDDMKAIGALGLKYDVPVHTDACLGGFLLAFMPYAGLPTPPFDFKVHGVTSISADTHKFGFAPKGSSVLLFNHKKFKHCQYFVTPNWPGGLYASPTIAGSRPGAIIVGCWATMLHFGLNGYTETTRKIVTTRRFIENKLRQITGIYVVGRPATSVIAFASKEFNIFRLMDFLKAQGWVLSALQFPSCIQFSLTFCQTAPGVAEKFVADVQQGVADILKNPLPDDETKGTAAIYGASQKIPDRTIVSDVAAMFLDALYDTTL